MLKKLCSTGGLCNMQGKLISVVIPTYNRKEKLLKCLESVLAQTYKNIEVIVVDDGSQDGTEELFKNISDSRVKYFRYDTNKGACYARNYGAQRSLGDLLAFQDSDDIWHEDKLEKQYEFLVKSGADMCFCGMNRVAGNGILFYFPVHKFHQETALEDFLTENRAGTQTMLMHRYVWDALKFDEQILRYQDWDFGIRAAAGYQLSYLPEALVESEVDMDSISSIVKSYPHLLYLYEKHRELYEHYPRADAVMNRRMGKRIHSVDSKIAAEHFKKSYRLSGSFYDLAYMITDQCRMAVQVWGKKVLQ